MIGNNAKWHTSCRGGINKQKIERARVKHGAIPSPVKTRRMRLGTACTTQKHQEGVDAKYSQTTKNFSARSHQVIRRTGGKPVHFI